MKFKKGYDPRRNVKQYRINSVSFEQALQRDGRSHRTLSELTGIHHGDISHLKKGRKRLSFDELDNLAITLNVDMNDLILEE